MKLKSILVLFVILIGLGGYFYFFNTSEPPPEKEEPRVYVWSIEMDEIKHIEIRLPREDKSEAFIRIPEGDKFPWHFDDPQLSSVDISRWGGGIPLLLSGPGAERIIAEDATEEKLAEFGLTQPQMEIILTLNDGNILNIDVGDKAPDGINFYVKAPSSNDVCLVDYTWYEVLERLVKEPPYVSPSAD